MFKKNILFKKLLIFLLIVCNILQITTVNVKAANFYEAKRGFSALSFEPVWKSQSLFDEIEDSTKSCYKVKKNYSVVRNSPSEKEGQIINHLHAGEYLFGEIVTNRHNNRWLKTYNPTTKDYFYVYEGNLEKHTVHSWYAIQDTSTGWYGYCDCGYMHFEYYNNPDASFTFDSVEVLSQIVYGNYYIETYSLTAALASIALGFTPVGTIMDIRDLSADVIHCVIGNSCSATSLILDMAAFIPFLDAAKYTDNMRVVKQLGNTDDLYVDTYKELRKVFKGNSEGIEVHHLLEKRFAGLVDISENDFLATPLLKAEHQIYTNKFREIFPYGSHYESITLSEMKNAINDVYIDTPELREQTLKWVETHWIGLR